MADFSHYPLQKSIYETLSGHAPLMAIVTGIFDRVPQGTAFPYVTIGESTGDDWSSATTSGMQQKIALHIWSREGGRKETTSIMEKIHALLHDADLSVEGHTLVMIRFAASSIVLGNDGYTYQGIMKFTALLEAV